MFHTIKDIQPALNKNCLRIIKPCIGFVCAGVILYIAEESSPEGEASGGMGVNYDAIMGAVIVNRPRMRVAVKTPAQMLPVLRYRNVLIPTLEPIINGKPSV